MFVKNDILMVQKTQGPCSFKKNIDAEKQFKLQEEL